MGLLKTLRTSQQYGTGGLGDPQLGPHNAERRNPLLGLKAAGEILQSGSAAAI